MRAGMKKLGFEPSEVDPGVFFGHGMAVVAWVDDCLFFGPDARKIDEMIEVLHKAGFALKREEPADVFTFLGVDLTRTGDEITLSQHNLIWKSLEGHWNGRMQP